ncbi:MAG: dual specificity protein phosphatase family protein [Desulfobacterales bacterium]|nr:dual specificity protein phosphatase family protein [Desulfobacterales bacterium]
MFAKKPCIFIASIFVLLSAVAVPLTVGQSSGASTMATPRPGYWATPLQRKGLPNLHQVTPTLYRGAQPTAVGMRQLKAMGVKTVLNLRSFNSDRDELRDTGLAYEHIAMKAWHPEREDIIRFLQITTDQNRTPVFVHCQHGADRTGLMCAVYRVAVGGWTKEEAIREMTQGGFGHHVIWSNLTKFIEDLDIDAIKKEAGIDTVGPQQPVLSVPQTTR